MLSHTNMLANAQDAARVLPLTDEELTVSFLPLSHGFERTCGLYTVLYVGGCIAYGGGTVTILKDLADIKPTMFCCVPRVLELVYRRVWGERESATFPKRQILDWALTLGKTVGTIRAESRSVPFFQHLQHQVADRIVFQKLRHLLGGRVRGLISARQPR